MLYKRITCCAITMRKNKNLLLKNNDKVKSYETKNKNMIQI